MLQTPAERRLVDELAAALEAAARHGAGTPRLLNVGAGTSLSIERQLAARGAAFVADRVDVAPCAVVGAPPFVGTAWQCPVERMDAVPGERYDAAFANYLLEHVRDVEAAAREIGHVLKPGGLFVTTVPNPRAPQFVVARLTPLAFHRWARGGHAHETVYAYRSVGGLVRIFERAGFAARTVALFSFVEGYAAERGRALGGVARFYDRAVGASGATALMGEACVSLTRR